MGHSSTTLRLELRGVVASSDPRFAHAIIADGAGKESVYFLASEVPGGAIVAEVYADRVILRKRPVQAHGHC